MVIFTFPEGTSYFLATNNMNTSSNIMMRNIIMLVVTVAVVGFIVNIILLYIFILRLQFYSQEAHKGYSHKACDDKGYSYSF